MKLMGEQDAPGDSIAYTVPQITSPVGGYAVGSIFDHFGLPTVGQVAAGQTVTTSSLPLRAYRLIFLEWFRDQNLVNEGAPIVSDGPDSPVNFILYNRAKAHDYFTSCLPWPQKFTAPTVPLGGQARIAGIGRASQGAGAPAATIYETGGIVTSYADAVPMSNFGDWYGEISAFGNPEIYADLSSATGVTINQLRQSFLVQQLLERDARNDARLSEMMGSWRPAFPLMSSSALLLSKFLSK